MQLYDIKLSLGRPAIAPGRPHTMSKTAISAAEVMVLRSIHGGDAVTDIVELDDTKRKEADAEYFKANKIQRSYGTELKYLVGTYTQPAVERVFGTLENAQLPAKLQNTAPIELDV